MAEDKQREIEVEEILLADDRRKTGLDNKNTLQTLRKTATWETPSELSCSELFIPLISLQ